MDGLSLPAWIYRDAEFFEREKQAIFRSKLAGGLSPERHSPGG